MRGGLGCPYSVRALTLLVRRLAWGILAEEHVVDEMSMLMMIRRRRSLLRDLSGVGTVGVVLVGVVLVGLVLVVACHPPREAVPRRPLRGETSIRKHVPATRPAFGSKVCRQVLLRLGMACYRRGLRFNPRIFGKGGRVVIRWRADRAGALLSFDFVENSFTRWEIDGRGQTVAACIVAGVQGEKQVSWSREGWAPLRFHALRGPASQPASQSASQPASQSASRPASQPVALPASRPGDQRMRRK